MPRNKLTRCRHETIYPLRATTKDIPSTHARSVMEEFTFCVSTTKGHSKCSENHFSLKNLAMVYLLFHLQGILNIIFLCLKSKPWQDCLFQRSQLMLFNCNIGDVLLFTMISPEIMIRR